MAEWTRQQLLVACHLYCEIPFGRIHHRNPTIIEFAEKIGRTPSALALKLTNIASLDPAITSTGRTGMRNASAADRAMWTEMNADWDWFVSNSQEALADLGISETPRPVPGESADYSGSDTVATTKVRVGQTFFRKAVLSAYDYRCCITGLSLTMLLVASHIIPWREDSSNRLNPRNGLCLSALHDRAFDAGIITIDEEMRVKVSRSLETKDDEFLQSTLLSFDGGSISLPEKFSPSPEFLSYHREHIFRP